MNSGFEQVGRAVLHPVVERVPIVAHPNLIAIQAVSTTCMWKVRDPMKARDRGALTVTAIPHFDCVDAGIDPQVYPPPRLVVPVGVRA